MKTKKTITGTEGITEPGENWSWNYTREQWKAIFKKAREWQKIEWGKSTNKRKYLAEVHGRKPLKTAKKEHQDRWRF